MVTSTLIVDGQRFAQNTFETSLIFRHGLNSGGYRKSNEEFEIAPVYANQGEEAQTGLAFMARTPIPRLSRRTARFVNIKLWKRESITCS
jgi:hypothetical protein